MKTTTKKKLQKVITKEVKRKSTLPLWNGPCGAGPQGGITQGLLSRKLACPDRFRVLAFERLGPAPMFSQRMDYGSMWHVCEESLAAGNDWVDALESYVADKLLAKYRTQHEDIVHWMSVCKIQFPIYVDWWKHHPDVKYRTPLLQEAMFDIPYYLKGSGRVVRLRGKFDSIDLIGSKTKKPLIFLQENKTKGEIDEYNLPRQLKFDLQTMFYLNAMLLLQEYSLNGLPPELEGYEEAILPESALMGNLVGFDKSIGGVRYNVIRRPLSGGKHSIRQHQPSKQNPQGESKQDFYARLGGLIKEDSSFFFMRWMVETEQKDLENFRLRCLDPLLEQTCDWYHELSGCQLHQATPSEYRTPLHYRMPYGVYNPTLEGRSTDVDDYLLNGSRTGLTRAETIFPELEE